MLIFSSSPSYTADSPATPFSLLSVIIDFINELRDVVGLAELRWELSPVRSFVNGATGTTGRARMERRHLSDNDPVRILRVLKSAIVPSNSREEEWEGIIGAVH